jgi:heptosyltransferase-2
LPRRVVVAPNWIGDAVMAIPFLRALRTKHGDDGEIAVLAKRGPGAVLAAVPGVRWIPRRGLVADALALSRGRFDEAWLLPNSFRSAVAPFLGGVRDRIGYATDRRDGLLTRPVSAPPRTSHQLRDYDALLASRGIAPDYDPPWLVPPKAARDRADAVLSAADLVFEGLGFAPAPIVLLAPGAAFSWTKRWPEESWGTLASALEDGGASVAFVIGPGEEAIAAKALSSAGRPLPVLGADLDPVELAALLARARVVVANDSGPMHLAAAVGTPVVALFGPTDPGRTGPTGSRSRVLDLYVFCSPCFLKECPYAHECLRGISVERVVGALEELLAAS